MTREEAIAVGAKTYMGKPCCRGHDGKRYVLGRHCCKCKNGMGGNNRHLEPSHDIERGPRPRRKFPEKSKPLPSPHVLESDWLKPITKAQLMAGRA